MELSLHTAARTDFFAKREEREWALKEAISQIESFKKRYLPAK